MAGWADHFARIAAMDFDWVYLNPISYPGFSGSLYAVKDERRLHPLLKGDDPRPDGQIIAAMVAEAHERGLKVMLDLVINHASRDSLLAEAHPEWFVRDARGGLVSPHAADPNDPDNPDKRTVWGDLAEFDLSPGPARQALVGHFADLVGWLVGLGVDGFRCDAAYKVPAEVWAGVIGAARRANPETRFFAETLGCATEEVAALAPAGFDMLFNSACWWDFRADWFLDIYAEQRTIAPSVAFPESHDTERFAATLADLDPEAAAARAVWQYLYAASVSSGVMLPVGYELGFARRLDVVGSRPGQWEVPRFDISAAIGAINRAKASHLALSAEVPMRRLDSPTGVVGLLRQSEFDPDWALIVINPSGNGPWSLDYDDPDDPLARRAAQGGEPLTAMPEGPWKPTAEAPLLDLADGEVRLFVGP
nr:alpha-amylase family glycosyl hydrolase [Roseospirillum parvum]